MYKMPLGVNRYIQPLYYDISKGYVSITTRNFDSSKKLRVLNGDVEWFPNYQYRDGRLLLELPPYGLKSGNYDIINGDILIEKMALNDTRVESAMEVYTNSELAEFGANNKNIDWIDIEKTENVSTNEGFRDSSNDLFKFALVLSLFFIISESLFIRFL